MPRSTSKGFLLVHELYLCLLGFYVLIVAIFYISGNTERDIYERREAAQNKAYQTAERIYAQELAQKIAAKKNAEIEASVKRLVAARKAAEEKRSQPTPQSPTAKVNPPNQKINLTCTTKLDKSITTPQDIQLSCKTHTQAAKSNP